MSRVVGNQIEDTVSEYFRKSGWVIVGQNYYAERSEVDIIAQFQGEAFLEASFGEIAIIEVKYRSEQSPWSIDVVPRKKRQHLSRVGTSVEEAILTGNLTTPNPVTGFQFVVVLIEGSDFQIVWNAFDDILG